jgi:hypothetical protein
MKKKNKNLLVLGSFFHSSLIPPPSSIFPLHLSGNPCGTLARYIMP